jgi:hypothetical protein
MSCPYLEEVMMAFCRAYPVKKLVPRARITTSSPCVGGHFESCPFFREVVARMNPCGDEAGMTTAVKGTEESR